VIRHRAGGRATQVVALGVAAASNAAIGGWAAFDPSGFYTGFPGLGHHWVSSMGPYDQHLVVDVGFLFLALTVTLVVALFSGGKLLVRTASVSALVFTVPHLGFHAGHLDGFSNADAIAELVSLAVTVAAPVVAFATTFFPADGATSTVGDYSEPSGQPPVVAGATRE
jgi:hypothetical protein